MSFILRMSLRESRYAIFGENRFSSISRPKDIMPNLEESQRDDHSHDVPSKILEPRKVLRNFWKEAIEEAIDDEIGSILENNTRVLSDLPPGCKPLGKPVDQLEYSRVIGCLLYAMTSTRLDIAYDVGRLSRFTSNPSRQHRKTITRVFKYLRGTKDYGLSYVGYTSVLEAYSDASWINHAEDSSSMSRWVFLLRRGAISWASKKQTWNMSLWR
ncbi:hypothetical protein Tco_1060825 [Tanacetum coccineum]